MQVGSLIAFLSYFMQILMAVLLATFILVHHSPRVRLRRTHFRSAGHRTADHQPAASGTARGHRGRDPAGRRVVQLPRRRPPCAAGCFVDRAARDDDRDRRVDRFRQVDAGVADLPAVRRDGRSVRMDGVDVRDFDHRTAVGGDRCGAPARISVLRHRRRQSALRQGRRDRGRDVGRAEGGGRR